MAEGRENIVMFPFMAQGHTIPFLALALHIEKKKGYSITFVSTPLNIKKLRSAIPPTSSIRLLEIPFCSSDHGFPPNTENTDVLPYYRIIDFLHASLSLKPAFRELILNLINEQHGCPPLCIIADIFFGWTADVAKELGVFHAIFTRSGRESGITSELCNKWLDAKPANSVLYIAFGSQNTISGSQMKQLAMALEDSGTNFIWVVRPPLGFDINSEFKAGEWLPEGFEQRIQDQKRGLLVHKWAPQLEILSHKSVSAFLTHCGWNSVLEALSHGVPLMGWPMAAEQFFNSMLLEKEIGVSVEVARGPTCEVKHEDITKKIELVMNETEKRKEMRRKACEVRDMIKDAIRDDEGFKGSSVKVMDEFFHAAFSQWGRTKLGQNHEAMEKKENIVMFPFMAQGHIIPFLALALEIQKKRGCTITFVNTPLNIKKLRSSLPPNTSIRLVEIPFNSSDHGLPPNTENTNALPYPLIFRFIEASLSLKLPFRKLISELIAEQNGHLPLCLVVDMFFGWSVEIAHEFGVSHAIFIHVFPEWLNSDGLLVNTVGELDKIGLMYFRRKIGRPVWPVGPLATALEVSGKYFIWVVRPPTGFDINSEFKAEEWLPQGFEQRIQDQKRGLLVHKWAPQVEILSHKSISAFLSHCGWNSVLEALSHGVPIIGWPMAADQFSNVVLLEKEVGVCVEVARGPRCEVKHEDIVKKIELVMNDTEKGKEMRRKAHEVRDIIKDAIRDEEGFKGSSMKAMDEFFSAALSRREKTNLLHQPIRYVLNTIR
ncbi:unnamed protein product, partial [Vitis vinifera]